MAALFPAITFGPAAVVGYGTDLMTSQLGLIVLTVGVAPIVFRKGMKLLRGAVR